MVIYKKKIYGGTLFESCPDLVELDLECILSGLSSPGGGLGMRGVNSTVGQTGLGIELSF